MGSSLHLLNSSNKSSSSLLLYDMQYYAFICTRSSDLTDTTKELVSYLSSIDTKVKILAGEDSLFSAYDNALHSEKLDPSDIIILCHDDIKITTSPSVFKEILEAKLKDPKTGFLGVAGTKTLGETAVWWDQSLWKQHRHTGYVLHGDDISSADATFYGNYGQAVVMDGLFLAATAKTLKLIGLQKPKRFIGNWDFYDILYTYKAHNRGLKNYTVPITILHQSRGELAGRDSWHQNRAAFLRMTEGRLPVSI